MVRDKKRKKGKGLNGQPHSKRNKAVGDKQTLSALYSVVDETRRLFHRLGAVAKQVHRQGELSGGRRGILKDLERLGPQTVPQMARARPVSRQHIQTIVNQLADEGYVEFIENPAHKRSRLVGLTYKGKDLIDEMDQREGKLLSGLNIGIAEEDMRTASAVLRALREFFESPRWRQRLRSVKGKRR